MRDFPIHVEFELTNRCNLACLMCPHRIMERQQGDMNMAILKKAVDECRGKVKTTYLHQIGEPLLYPHIIEAINYVADAGIRTSISTNGMLLDELMTEKLLNSQLHEIYLMLDSMDKHVFENLRFGGDFDTVYNNYQYFLSRKVEKKSDIHVKLQMIAMQENRGDREKFRQIVFAGIDELDVKPFSSFAGAVTKSEPQENRRFGCAKPTSQLTIQWNGDMVPCCRDYNGFMVMGNVQNQTISEVWNSKKYNEFRANYKTSNLCERC